MATIDVPTKITAQEIEEEEEKITERTTIEEEMTVELKISITSLKLLNSTRTNKALETSTTPINSTLEISRATLEVNKVASIPTIKEATNSILSTKLESRWIHPSSKQQAKPWK
jgi:hypothetical protein